MRGIYISPGYGLVGAVMGAVIALAPVAIPWPLYGLVEDFQLILLVPRPWAIAIGSVGAVVGGVTGALAGRSIVEATVGLFQRVAHWLPWWQ